MPYGSGALIHHVSEHHHEKILLVFFLIIGASLASAQAIKVVYHLNTGVDTAATALINIQNHPDADPQARVVVVTHGPGVDFLIQDARDARGREFSAVVSKLAGQGVAFRVCNNTLVSLNIDPGQLLMEAEVVPSGVAEVARLQAREGFVALKP